LVGLALDVALILALVFALVLSLAVIVDGGGVRLGDELCAHVNGKKKKSCTMTSNNGDMRRRIAVGYILRFLSL
jgi:hypothetical protein